MKSLRRITLLTQTLLTTLTTTSMSLADVNMKDASYVKTWIDLEVVNDQKVFQLRRTYNSRTLHQGLFGFGWCSDLEKTLDLRRMDEISVRDCRLNAPIRFKKKKENHYENDPGPSPKEKIEYKNQNYIRTTAKKTQQIYNKLGRLTSLIDTNKNILEITYDVATGKIKKLTFNKTSELKIVFDTSGRYIQSITAKNTLGASYLYDGKDLLQVKNSWGNTFKYSYDDVHNLTQIHYPDKTSEVLTYDKENDWILQIRNRQNCLEIFKYTQVASKNSYTASAEKRCNGKVITKTNYEFRHKARADGSKYLDQVEFTQGNKIQRISYQNQTGPLNESQ